MKHYALGVTRGGVSERSDQFGGGYRGVDPLFVYVGEYHEVSDLARRLFEHGLIDDARISPALDGTGTGTAAVSCPNAQLILDALRGKEA